MTITEFIEAQLARVEQTAREATPGPWRWEEPSGDDWPSGDEGLVSDGSEDNCGYPTAVLMGWGYDASGIEGRAEDRAHIVTHDPAHVLAWVAAIRAVVAEYKRLESQELDYPRDLEISGARKALRGVCTRIAAIWAGEDDE